MKIDTTIEQVKSDVTASIKQMKDRRNRDKKKSAFAAIYMGIVSAITTICIGIVSYLPETYSNFFGIVSLLTSASLTVVAAWDGIFHHKKLWISAVMARNELYFLETDIRHAEAGLSGVSQTQANEFYDRYKQIMKDTNERWYKIRE
jgi:hypothetical protein